jgi:glutamate-5-semialdehyde dehydrogenase
MGNCYLYWSPSGDLDLVRWMIIDSHSSEPDPVNAIEKVLVSPNQNPSLLTRLFNSLKEKGFQLRGDRVLLEDFSEYLTPASETEWGKPYLDKRVAFKVVDDLASAIAWINRYKANRFFWGYPIKRGIVAV